MTKNDLRTAIVTIISQKTSVHHWGNIDERGHGTEQSVIGVDKAADAIISLLEDLAK
jgi:hypothetical protein